MKLHVDDIIYDEKIYPRELVNRGVVLRYQADLEKMNGGIVVDLKNRIVDGYHRVLAHRAEGKDEVEVEIFESDDDLECRKESARLNNSHGVHLTAKERKDLAVDFYNDGVSEEEISDILSIGTTALAGYLSEEKKEEKNERNQKILQMWVACYSQEEIAGALGIDQKTVSNAIKSFRKNSELVEIPEPIDLQLSTDWRFGACDREFGTPKYPGRMPGQIVEHLLHYYTDPFDLVMDPMAGGGTTVDVCKKWNRRYLCFDINPMADSKRRIRQHDITNGLPSVPVKQRPKLIILDPPYAGQKKGEYTKLDTDLSNMDLDAFYEIIHLIASDCLKILEKGGKVAFIISSLKKDGNVEPLGARCFNIFEDVGFKFTEWFMVPYHEAASEAGYWIKDARENKRVLRGHRDLLIFKMGE